MPREDISSPAGIEQFFARYGDDQLLFKVLQCAWRADRPLDAVSDIAAPLRAPASDVRRSLLSLVLEGFITARQCDGETLYMLTHDPSARIVAGQLLRRVIEQGACR
jgi:hypothetical protein